MHFQVRKISLTLSILAVTALSACQSDAADRSTGDVLAQDSTLDLAVLSATGDSIGAASGDTNLGTRPADAPDVSAQSPAPAPVRTIVTTPQPATIAAAPARVAASTPRAQQTRRNQSTRLISSSRTTTPSRASGVRTPARSRQRARVLRSADQSQSSTVIASTPAENSAVPATSRSTNTRAISVVLPMGSSVSLVTRQKICASSAKVGDTFSASLAKDVVGPSGVVIPAGTLAKGEVISTAGNDSRMRVAIKSIDFDGYSYPMKSDVTFTEMQSVKIKPRGGSASRVLAGAGIGALLGRVMGGNAKATIIGAAGGATAGAVVANQSVRYDQCVPDGGQIIAHLAQPLRVQLGD